MSDEQGLLDAIVEAPDDDAPRLVYADWLQSRGDPRGELIQLQCQLAAVPDDERRRAIRIQENKLLAAHGEAWLAPIRAALPPPPPYVTYKLELVRGFVEEATLPLSVLPHVDALLAAAPLVRSLRVQADFSVEPQLEPPHLDGVLAAPAVRRLRRLELQLAGGGNELAREVAEADTLAGLRELALHGSLWGESVAIYRKPAAELAIDDTGAALLAGSPHLANLTHLDLESNRIGLPGVTAIAHGAWRLRELVLSNNAIEIDEAAELAARRRKPGAGAALLAASLAGPALAGLEVLHLAGIALSPREVAALVSSPVLANLRDLDLERCHLGATGVAALCDAFALPALRRLRLERNSLGDAGAHAIAGCAALANLTSLEAGHNRIGQKGGTALATTPHFRNLERLLLNEPRWKPEMTALFAASPTLANARIYLAGRLVSRKQSKPYAVEAAPAARAAEPKARRAKKPRS